MWKKQIEINKSFDSYFKIEDTFLYQEVKYKIMGKGHTHVVCINDESYGEDLILSKKDFLKKIKRTKNEN